jgi:hypothetical protein
MEFVNPTNTAGLRLSVEKMSIDGADRFVQPMPPISANYPTMGQAETPAAARQANRGRNQ